MDVSIELKNEPRYLIKLQVLMWSSYIASFIYSCIFWFLILEFQASAIEFFIQLSEYVHVPRFARTQSGTQQVVQLKCLFLFQSKRTLSCAVHVPVFIKERL